MKLTFSLILLLSSWLCQCQLKTLQFFEEKIYHALNYRFFFFSSFKIGGNGLADKPINIIIDIIFCILYFKACLRYLKCTLVEIIKTSALKSTIYHG